VNVRTKGLSPPEKDELASFFAAGFPRAGEALNYLDAKGFAGFDEADKRLMALMLGWSMPDSPPMSRGRTSLGTRLPAPT